MTDAFEIRRASPAYPPKSGCGVPPQAVQEASRLPSSALFISGFQIFSYYPTTISQQHESPQITRKPANPT